MAKATKGGRGSYLRDMDPTERAMRAKLAGLNSIIGKTKAEVIAPMHEALDAKWAKEARELMPDADEEEITRQAGFLRKRHFAKLALAAYIGRRDANAERKAIKAAREAAKAEG